MVSFLFEALGILIDRLAPKYSLDVPSQLLLMRQKLNRSIREDIYRKFIQFTWTNPPSGLRLKMAFYIEHFLEVGDGLLIQPSYTSHHWAHSLQIPLGQFHVGFHRLQIEPDHHIDKSDKNYQLCYLREVKMLMKLSLMPTWLMPPPC